MAKLRIKLEGDIVRASVDGHPGSLVDISPVQGGLDIRDPFVVMAKLDEWMQSAALAFECKHAAKHAAKAAAEEGGE